VATVDGDIVHLVANDAPDEKLWSAASDVRIQGDSIEVRIGGRINGMSCQIELVMDKPRDVEKSSNELKPCDLAVVKSRLKNLDHEALNG
jgi:hypothetical protein